MSSNPYDDPNFGAEERKPEGYGGQSQAKTRPATKKPSNPYEDPEYGAERGIGDELKDTAVSVGQGFVRGAEGFVSAVNAGSDTAKSLREIDENLDSMKSGGRRAEQDANAANMRRARESGSTWEEMKAYGEAFADAPIDTTIESLGTAAPQIAVQALTKGRGGQVVSGAMGGTQGAGFTKSNIYEDVKAEHLANGATEEEAEARAQEAQAYSGENLGQIGIGAGLGTVASTTGVERAVNRMGRRIPGTGGKPGVLKETAKGFAKEAPLEAVQGGHEQLASNTAVQNEGFDRPTWEGVAGSATLEGLAGGVAGGGTGAAEGFSSKRQRQRFEAEQEALRQQEQERQLEEQAQTDAAPEMTPMGAQAPIQGAEQKEPAAEDSQQWTSPGQVPPQYATERLSERTLPSEQLGLDPNEGPISEAAVMAVDSGVSDQMAQQAQQEAAESGGTSFLAGESIDRETGEVIDAQPQPFAEQNAMDAAVDTAEEMDDDTRIAQLQEKLKTLSGQARASGWDERLIGERDRTLKELAGFADRKAVDEAASEAATSPTNDLPEPTEAQIEAGNYKKGHVRVQGMDVAVENPRGSVRKGKRPDGTEWQHEMSDHYGYIKRTKGADSEQVDVYVGPQSDASQVFVIDQLDQETGGFDEHKVMMGYPSQQAAVVAYKSNFDPDWQVGPVRPMSVDEFKGWLKEGDTSKPASEAPAQEQDQVTADSAVAGAEGYQQRSEQRLGQIEQADSPEAVDQIMTEHGEDPDGHLEGYDRVKRAADQRKRDIENPPEPGIVERSGSERQAQGIAERLTRENPGESYRVEPRQDGWGTHYAVIDNKQNPAQQGDTEPADPAPEAQPVTEEPAVEQEADSAPDEIDIAAVTRKQIPDMSDAELDAAIEHYGTGHKRTKKLKREQAKRQKANAESGQDADDKPSSVKEGIEQAQKKKAEGKAPAESREKSDAVPIEDARRAEKLQQARDTGKQAAADGDDRTPPDWMNDELSDAWLAGYGDGIAEKSNAAEPESDQKTTATDAKVDSDNQPETEARDGQQQNRPELEGSDTEGVSEADSGRGELSAQPGSAQADSGRVEAGQPEDVAAADGGRADKQAGDRSAGTDVAGNGQPDGSGVPGDGRAGAGRENAPDDGAGEQSRGRSSTGVTPEPRSEAAPGPGNFHYDNPLEIVGGGQVQRFKKNQAAIERFNDIRDTGRSITEDDQRVIAAYTGWGSFGQELFQGTWKNPKPKKGWEERDAWLRDQLGQSEWEGMQRSIINAHYTDPPTVMAMWDMVKKMGFRGGRVLEPSMGIGNFFGMMPEELKTRSNLAGIELDPVTGGMAQMLYPDANINVMGYEESKTPDNFYDVVIGNWPFANIEVPDRRYQKLNPNLHDYFFLKGLDQTRPGGLVVGITTHGSMDKKNKVIRNELARKGELVAAYRLPTGAFQEYAGTKVVTDIIILRKRPERLGMVPTDAGWLDSVPVKTPSGEEVFINEYFANNPDNVIGTVDFGHGTTSGRPGLIVHRPDNVADRLKEIAAKVPDGAYLEDSGSKQISYVANHLDDREGSLVRDKDGALGVVRGEYIANASDVVKYAVKSEATTKAREDQLDRLIGLRKAYGELIDAERDVDESATAKRKELKRQYDSFVDEHGQLNGSFGLKYLQRIQDPFYPALAALERKAGEGYEPSDILTKSTIREPKKIKNPSVSEAYVVARNQYVNPTLGEIARIAKKSEQSVRKELIEKGAIFDLPNGDIESADIYLSGNVRQKLRQATAALESGDTRMKRNVEALERVKPKDIPYFNIETQMGATWVPKEYYAQFVAEMLGLSSTSGIEVTYRAGQWKIRMDSDLNRRPEASSGYGTEKYPFSKLVNAAISNRPVTIKSKDTDGKEYVNTAATTEVNGKVAEMRMKFGEWVWSDPERREDLEREYNETRNSYAIPTYDGSFMAMEGMALSLGNGPFDLREHQQNAIWRALVTRKSINAHEVGTGKTFTMGGIAVESRRYGIAKKPLLLAHNANSKSVANEIQQMYPAAKILYIDNLDKKQIATRMRQIANDDWDTIVLPHSLINNIGFKEETLMQMAQQDIDELMAEAEEAAKDDGVEITKDMLGDPEEVKDELAKLRSPTAKELVKARNNIIASIKKQAIRSSKEGAIPFEDLGIDMVLVDEVHEFKKPPLATKMRIKGMNTQSNAKSIALRFMLKYVRGMNSGGNVHTFSGTPLTNSMTEAFHQMRYIMEEEMQEAGLDQWDGWFGSFAQEEMDIELTAAGEYESVTRLSKFVNTPELRRMVGQYMDVVFSEDMPEMQPRKTKSGKTLSDPSLTELERAELLNGRTEGAKDRPYKQVLNETADLTDDQRAHFAKIQEYAKQFRAMSGKERVKAMRRGDPQSPIVYEGLAAKVSFDARLMYAEELAGEEGKVPDDPNSKPSRVIKNVMEVYNSDERATQVIFTQLGLSKSATESITDENGNKRKRTKKVFSTAHDMVERMVQQGIPRHQIALVTGATSKDKRAAIADAMNRSEIRVVIGSTQSLGVGVNMQKNLRAMHHMDAPWMPGDLEQRNGRGQRQGNQWNTVREYRYLTDRIDGRRWQLLVKKQQFIEKFLKADDSVRIIDADGATDEDNDMLESFAEAAGDARVLQRAKIEKKINMVMQRERLHSQGIANAKRQVRNLTSSINSDQERVDRYESVNAEQRTTSSLKANAGNDFTATIDGKAYTERGKAQEALGQYVSKNIRMGSPVREVGTYGDLKLAIGMAENAAEPQLYADYGNGVEVLSNKPTMASFEATLRGFGDRLENLRRKIQENRDSRDRAEKVSKEPFQQADELKRLEKQLADLEQDLQDNPVAPPAWLRTGAPVETEVLWNGEPFTVTGHRWNDQGWYVLAEDKNGTVAIPYMEVKDGQGFTLYQEREFEAPGVVEKSGEGDGEQETPAFMRQSGAVSRGLSRDAVQATVDRFFERYPGAANVRVQIHDTARTLPGFDQARDSAAAISGQYVSTEDTLHLVRTAFDSRRSVNEALQEEILVHKGLGFFKVEDRNQFYRDVQQATQESREVKALWDQVVSDYEPVAKSAKLNKEQANRLYAEELLGSLAQTRINWLQRGWRTIFRAVKRLLVKAGWINDSIGVNELRSRIDLIARAFERGREAPRRDFSADIQGKGADIPAFSRSTANPSSIPRGQASAAFGKKMTRRIKGKLADLKPAGLGALPLMYLRDFAPKGMAALDRYLDEKRAMDADRNEMHTRYDQLAQRWLKERMSEGVVKDKVKTVLGLRDKNAAPLDKLMHDATIAGIDPSKPRKKNADKALYQILRARYEKLPATQQQLFKDVRDAYGDQVKAMEDAIAENIRKSAEFAKRRAARDLQLEIRKAKDELTGPEQDQAIEEAEEKYKKRVASADHGRTSRTMLLRQKFEQMRVDEPYFPLKRFGDYFVALREKDGTLRSFSMFEKAADMEEAAEQLGKDYPDLEVTTGRQSNKEDIQGAIDPGFVADIQELVSENVDDESLNDAIYQMYLETLPDFSMRKSFIHRKKVPGYDQDAMRVFASTMFHSSHQIARLKHNLEMDELVEQVEEQASDAEDSADAMTVANELRRRHEWVMNPKGGKLAQHITSFAFAYQLGITPAAAFVNTTQTFMMGVPVLGTRFKSERKATAELLKASGEFVKGRGHVEKNLTGDEKAAFDEFMRLGLIDKTQAHDLAGVGETGVEYSAVRHKVMGAISYMFHHAERYNREVTSLAAYRMGRNAGLSHKQAIKEAADLTWQIHFDYSSGNRARYMQGDTAKILLVFRQHSINMLSRLAIDMRQALKGESKEVRREAMRRLAGIYGMFALMAGMMGVPGAQALLTVLNFMDDDDDPWTAEDKIKRYVTEALGEDAAGIFFRGVPGELANLSLTERIGMGNLWFFSPYREMEGRDAYYYWMEQALGAAPAVISNVFSGLSIMGEGHIMRGVETMLPKAGKDLLRGVRYSNEGVQSLNGYSMVDEASAWEVIAQSMGFMPASIAEKYDRNSALKNAEQRIIGERRNLLNRFAVATRTGDTEMRDRLRQKIREFNRRNPRVAITFDTIQSSMMRRAENRGKAREGVLIDKKLNYLRNELPGN